MKGALQLHRDKPVDIPPDRGRLLSPAQVVRDLMPEGTNERFVRRHVYPRVPLGRRVYFYEADVKRWLEEQRVGRAS